METKTATPEERFYVDIARAMFRLVKSERTYQRKKEFTEQYENQLLAQLVYELTRDPNIPIKELIDMTKGVIDVSDPVSRRIANILSCYFDFDLMFFTSLVTGTIQ